MGKFALEMRRANSQDDWYHLGDFASVKTAERHFDRRYSRDVLYRIIDRESGKVVTPPTNYFVSQSTKEMIADIRRIPAENWGRNQIPSGFNVVSKKPDFKNLEVKWWLDGF